MISYEKYKPSGIEWLGDIPGHWELKRFRYCFDNGKGLSITKENLIEKGIPCVNYGEVHSKYGFEVDPEKHPLLCVEESYVETNSSSLLKYGDFVFADTSEDIEGSGNFTHLAVNQCIFAGYHTVISRLKIEANPRFLAYSFDSLAYRTQIRSRVQGVKVYSITNKILKDTILWLPSPKEQTAIANYLDAKTSKIDLLVSNKKGQIEKLKEIRQIEINNAVTKGLNPNAKLKPSGIEWLGDIPEHWELKRIKDHVAVNDCSLCSDTKQYLEIRYLDISNVNNAGLTGEILELKFFEAPSRARRIVRNGDVIMSTVRPYLKAIAYLEDIPTNMIASTGFAVLTTKPSYFSKFLFYIIVSHWFNEAVNSQAVGASYPALNSEVLVASKIIVPPPKEQTAIANYLDEKISKIDQLISNIEKQIEQLEEIRKIEIYNAVTGKIKVA